MPFQIGSITSNNWQLVAKSTLDLPVPGAGEYFWAKELGINEEDGNEPIILVWESRHGKVIGQELCNKLLTLRDGHQYATWLPDFWKISHYPAGLTKEHVVDWLEYAFGMVSLPDHLNRNVTVHRKNLAQLILVAIHILVVYGKFLATMPRMQPSRPENCRAYGKV